MGGLVAGLVLDDDAVAGGPGIAACAAVTVSDQVVRGRILARGICMVGGERFGCGAAWIGHAFEFTTECWLLEFFANLQISNTGVTGTHRVNLRIQLMIFYCFIPDGISGRRLGAWPGAGAGWQRRFDLARISGCRACGGSG